MHPSYFAMVEGAEGLPAAEHHLPAETSEWLFHIGLWDEINRRIGTQFGQYEDETLQPELVAGALACIQSARAQIASQTLPQFQFTIAWDAGGGPIQCTARAGEVADDLFALTAFLEQAQQACLPVFCQL